MTISKERLLNINFTHINELAFFLSKMMGEKTLLVSQLSISQSLMQLVLHASVLQLMLPAIAAL